LLALIERAINGLFGNEVGNRRGGTSVDDARWAEQVCCSFLRQV